MQYIDKGWTYVEPGVHERIALRADLRGSPPVVVGQDEVLPYDTMEKDAKRDSLEKVRPALHDCTIAVTDSLVGRARRLLVSRHSDRKLLLTRFELQPAEMLMCCCPAPRTG